MEDEIIRPIYTTTLAFDGQDILNPLKEYPFSVSKINQIISLIITTIWSFLFIIAFQEIEFRIEFTIERILLYVDNQFCKVIITSLLILIILMIFMYLTRGTSQDLNTRKIDFIVVKQSDKKQN